MAKSIRRSAFGQRLHGRRSSEADPLVDTRPTDPATGRRLMHKRAPNIDWDAVADVLSKPPQIAPRGAAAHKPGCRCPAHRAP